ncbi:MAG: hypothetical protein ABI068_09475 [Ktedonobacterales bacterium]
MRERNDPRQARNVDLKAKYGITIDDYEAMFAGQMGQCAICGRADQKLVGRPSPRDGASEEPAVSPVQRHDRLRA